MLEDKDLQKIGEEVGRVIENNVTPVLDQLIDRVDNIEGRLNRIESQMVTKEYLDDKLADLEGVTVVRQRKEDKKVNLLIDILKEKKVIDNKDINRLKEIKVFPNPREELL